MRSRSSARPTSRCRMTTGATGRRQKNWGRWRKCPSVRGLSRASTFLRMLHKDDVAGRDKPGHDGRALNGLNGKTPAMLNRTEIADRLADSGYIADGELATAI